MYRNALRVVLRKSDRACLDRIRPLPGNRRLVVYGSSIGASFC